MSTWFALAWRSSSAWPGAAASAVALMGLLCALEASAQSAKPAVDCATCHQGVTDSYAHAGMRHAMESPGANPVLDSHPTLSVQMGRYAYNIQTKDGKSTYTVSDGTDSMTLPIRWMLGQHSQTWVLEKDGLLYESLVTYFPREGGLGLTPGDQKLTPQNLTEAMGRKLTTWEALRCFNCHASGAITGVRLNLDTLRPGLDCGRCHVDAAQHMADAANDNFKTLPKSLKKMNAEDISNFCGQCHRTWDTVMRTHLKGPAFVRFQPYRLENSKCFIGNDPRISCLACHDPHRQVNHDEAFYDSKCLACHAPQKTSAMTSAKTCTVSKKDCVSCHMPKVELPGGHTAFTDHQIRIVHAGDPYPN